MEAEAKPVRRLRRRARCVEEVVERGAARCRRALTDAPVRRMFCALCMKQKPQVAVAGATGAVGLEMIKTLEKREFPVGKEGRYRGART